MSRRLDGGEQRAEAPAAGAGVGMSGSGDWPGDETAETQPSASAPRRTADPRRPRGRRARLAPGRRARGRRPRRRRDPAARGSRAPRPRPARRSAPLPRARRDRRAPSEILTLALASGDRLLGDSTTLARGGALTSARLEKMRPRSSGSTEWAAEVGRFAGLLELVKTLQVCFDIGHRAQEWLILARTRTRRRTRAR